MRICHSTDCSLQHVEVSPRLFRRHCPMLICTRKIIRFAMIVFSVTFAAMDRQSLEAAEESLEAEVEAQVAVVLQRGKKQYLRSCAVCHGKLGEGVKNRYSDPLVGEQTVAELVAVITATMPEDDPESCVGEEAAAIATYLHQAFYSPAAQRKIEPPRVGLARLTGNQLRHSLADLYATESNLVWMTQEHGLKGYYYNGSVPRVGDKRLERTDQTLDFDFGHQGPGEGITPKDFCITWRGALRPDTTGEYEIVIDSTCSFLCYLGSYNRKFIDNHVQSGDKTEFRRTITLGGGRIYPLRIEFVQRKRKTEQPPAKFRLAWKPPHGAEQILPSRNLLALSAPAAFALQTKLPPDDRSYGYDRGITVDKLWDESTTNAALEFAQIACEELWPAYQNRHRKNSDENRSPVRSFLVELATAALRGVLGEEDRKRYIDEPVDATEDDLEAIKRSLLMLLKSPRFLYPLLDGVDGEFSKSQRVANRLALTLHDSLPTDLWWVRGAHRKEWEEEAQIRVAARRLVDDYRTRGKTRELMYEWLNLSQVGEIVKEKELFPEFDRALVGDLRASLDAFLDEVIWSGTGDYRQLFQADWTFTNERLSNFYGETWEPLHSPGAGLRRSVSDSEHRFGVLTHPYLLSKLSYHKTTSPIHRGVFLYRHVFGRILLPPQEAFLPLAPELHPTLTTRERVQLQTGSKNCQVCHAKINSLGFILENFDAVGRYRPTVRECEIDATGFYTSHSGKQVDFAGPRQLAEFLVVSEDAQRAFVNRAFQHFVKQPIAAFGPNALEELVKNFKEKDYNIRELLVEIAVLATTNIEDASAEQENREARVEGK